MMLDWSQKGVPILSKSMKLTKNVANGIQKAPDVVSERKTDPVGVRQFGTQRLGIAFGNL